MALNLIGGYDSDESDFSAASDEGFSALKKQQTSDEEEPSTSEEPTTELTTQTSTFKSALLGGDNDDSDEETESEQSSSRQTKAQKQFHLIQGPSDEHVPSFDPSRNTELECNVFMNEIKREEFLNKKILSQHVSLTEIKVEDDRRKKMGVCRAYKRGDCRRGEKCRFWHAQPGERKEIKPEEAAVTICEPSLYTSEPDAFKRKKLN